MTPKKGIVGRRYSQRAVETWATEDGEIETVALNRDDVFGPATVARHKAAAIAALEAEDIPATAILAEHPGGSMLRDRVLNYLDRELDSRAGIACRIVEQCIRVEQLPLIGAKAATLMGEAYRLGRLVMLGHVYGIDDSTFAKFQRKGADARTKYTDADRAAWRQMRANDYANHTDNRAAELIVERLGMPEKAVRSIRAELAKK